MLIETERLRIRELCAGDAPAFAQMAADGSLTDIGFGKDCGGWMEKWVTQAQTLTKRDNPAADYLAYAVMLKDTQTVIGSVGCSYYEDLQKTGITYFIGEAYRNRGYAAEAAVAYAGFFLAHYSLSGLIATVREENKASWRVVEKAGFLLTEKRLYRDLNDEKPVFYRFYERTAGNGAARPKALFRAEGL
ncbi:MAG: GNAT family N-acetyltransferase [Provencibacterium sp.]|nr:GNAT family N-acetyltransferase [Provencibacterium sp.]